MTKFIFFLLVSSSIKEFFEFLKSNREYQIVFFFTNEHNRKARKKVMKQNKKANLPKHHIHEINQLHLSLEKTFSSFS